MMNETDNASRDYQNCRAILKDAKDVLDKVTSALPEYDDRDWTAILAKNEKIVVLFFSILDYNFQGIAEIAQTLDAADAYHLGTLLDAHYGVQYHESARDTELHTVRYRVRRLFRTRKLSLHMMARVAGIGPQYPIFY